MNVQIDPSWKKYLSEEFDKQYFVSLTSAVRTEYQHQQCFPPGHLIFNAFNLCPFDQVKVVIIGQDPYHEPGQAMGLSFSVPEGVMMPPSLVNIFKEISDDLGKPMSTNGDLTRWARQGVLLLNATLTVRAHQANSHQRLGWSFFTDAAIKALAAHRDHIVYMLWGWLCAQQERLYRRFTQPYSGVGSSLTTLRQPRGMVRHASVLALQCLFRGQWTDTHRLVNNLRL